ncbi:hypothetical protein SBA3_310002 [Candidatus Sulfopaludibacter sp. SbA3]|nr:hypothetical protein SBA3_310002 [Candidatus Sulfopaludibacter sp. SbA3]
MVVGREKEVVEQSLWIGYDRKRQCMTIPKREGRFRGLLDIDRHYLQAAASVPFPDVLEMRSLRIALASPRSEEIEQDHFTSELGRMHRRRARRGEFEFGQALARAEPGVRSPAQIGNQSRSAD